MISFLLSNIQFSHLFYLVPVTDGNGSIGELGASQNGCGLFAQSYGTIKNLTVAACFLTAPLLITIAHFAVGIFFTQIIVY